MASMEYEKRKREEYEMQLFGFHSRAVYATLCSMIHEKIQAVSKKLCETLQKHNSEKGATLRADEKRLVKCYYDASMPHIKNLENIVNKYICIPEHVLLDEDKVQEKRYTQEEFEGMKKKLEDLQKRGKRAMIMNASLTEELRTIKQFQPWMQKIKELCDITESCNSCPDPESNTQEVVEDYKTLCKMYKSSLNASDKIKYNNIGKSIALKECDITQL